MKFCGKHESPQKIVLSFAKTKQKTRVFFPNSPTFLTLNVRNSIDREKSSKETRLLPASCLERKTKKFVDIFLNTRVIVTFTF